MKKRIDVSIIVVSYNHEKYIKDAIESVLKQKVNFNYEIIFADDCSKDNTQELIKKYTKNINNILYLFSKTNKGNTKNVLNAYQHAKGKYITCLEADDYWYSDIKLQTQYDFLENNKEYIAVSNKRFTVNKNGEKILSYPLNIKKDRDITLKNFLHGNYFSGVEAMFCNIFQDNIDKKFLKLFAADRMIGDLPLCIYLCSHGKVRVLAKDFSVYRTNTSGNTESYNSKLKLLKIAKDHVLILNRLSGYYSYDFSYLYASHLLEAKIGKILEKNKKEYKEIKELIPPNNKFLYLKMIPFLDLFLKNTINKIKFKI